MNTFSCIWHYACSLEVIVGMLCSIVQGPYEPHWQPFPLHPVSDSPNVLPFLADHHIFHGKEDLVKIKQKNILVNELRESMGTMLRCATYLIFKGHKNVIHLYSTVFGLHLFKSVLHAICNFPAQAPSTVSFLCEGNHLLPSQLPGKHTGHEDASRCSEPILNVHYSSTHHQC